MTNNNIIDYRKSMCEILFKELEYFQDKMSFLMLEMRKSNVKEETIKKLDSSIKTIIKIVNTYLRNDIDYINEENAESFGVYMSNIEEAVKAFFKSYIIENNLQDRLKHGRKFTVKLDNGKIIPKTLRYTDSIDSLCHLMYNSLAENRGLFIINKDNMVIKDQSIDYAYPSVIRAIKFVKNLQHHEIVDIPTDYRTDVKAFGNLFTLCSMLILIFNAYVEMLEDWIETIKIMI